MIQYARKSCPVTVNDRPRIAGAVLLGRGAVKGCLLLAPSHAHPHRL